MSRDLKDWIRAHGTKPNLRMAAKNGKAEIAIFDDIGPSWLGLIGAQGFKQDLEALGNVSEIRVLINSHGGDVSEGTAIYNLLKDHRAKVTTEVVGMAASIASLIFEAGDVRRVAENAALMIHLPWTITVGDEQDHEKQLQLLKSAGVQSAKTYAARTGNSEEQILEWMKAEKWIWSDEVVGLGFADEVIPNKAMAARFNPAVYAFKNAPEERLRALFEEFERNNRSRELSSAERPRLAGARALLDAVPRG